MAKKLTAESIARIEAALEVIRRKVEKITLEVELYKFRKKNENLSDMRK